MKKNVNVTRNLRGFIFEAYDENIYVVKFYEIVNKDSGEGV